jgi:cell division GTPase FtsZ
MFQLAEPNIMNTAKIKVIGIGGAGGNARRPSLRSISFTYQDPDRR